MNMFVKNSIKALGKLQSQRQVEVDEEAVDVLISQEARQFVINGEFLKTVFEQFKQDNSKFCSFRDMLMLYLVISNGLRVSTIMNMTIAQVEAAQAVVVEGVNYVTISVLRHKTSASRGAAKVTVSNEIFNIMKDLGVYVTKVCGAEGETLFRQQSGIPYNTASHVNRSLQRAWVHCGGYERFGKMNATINRKSITCIAREVDPAKAGDVAEQLKHRIGTADRFYHVRMSKKKSAQTVHFLNQLCESEMSTPPKVRKERFPGLQEMDIIAFRKILCTVYMSRDLNELIQEAEEWIARGRKYETDKVIMDIHADLEERLERMGINLNSEILNHIGIELVSDDYNVKSRLLSIISLELARYLGCDEPVYPHQMMEREITPKRPECSTSEPSTSAQQVRLKGSKQTLPDHVTAKVREIFANLMWDIRKGRSILKIQDVREQMDHFKGYTEQQIRDKIKTELKKQ